MNKDRIEGAGKDLKGKVKEGIGKATGSTKMEVEGKMDQVAGKVQNSYGKAKDAVDDAADDAADRSKRASTSR